MKRLTAIRMGVCVLLSCQGVVRAADSTAGSDSQSVISTTVPDEHKVEIVGDHAYVVFGEETDEEEEGNERDAGEEKIYPVNFSIRQIASTSSIGLGILFISQSQCGCKSPASPS